MPTLILALWIAGFVQLAIALANFVLPRKLNYRDNLSRLAPMVRQIFIVHSGYIVVLVAATSLAFAPELAGGRGLGRFLAASMAVFWACRLPLQLFYYDPELRRSNPVGDVAITVALLFLAATYASAALVHAS